MSPCRGIKGNLGNIRGRRKGRMITRWNYKYAGAMRKNLRGVIQRGMCVCACACKRVYNGGKEFEPKYEGIDPEKLQHTKQCLSARHHTTSKFLDDKFSFTWVRFCHQLYWGQVVPLVFVEEGNQPLPHRSFYACPTGEMLCRGKKLFVPLCHFQAFLQYL